MADVTQIMKCHSALRMADNYRQLIRWSTEGVLIPTSPPSISSFDIVHVNWRFRLDAARVTKRGQSVNKYSPFMEQNPRILKGRSVWPPPIKYVHKSIQGGWGLCRFPLFPLLFCSSVRGELHREKRTVDLHFLDKIMAKRATVVKVTLTQVLNSLSQRPNRQTKRKILFAFFPSLRFLVIFVPFV